MVLRCRWQVALLNEYFTRVVGVVMDNSGVVDKYIGDCIMAEWGVPFPQPEDAVNACRAALGMKRALAELNEDRGAQGKRPIHVGVGICTAEVVLSLLDLTELYQSHS